MQALKGTCGQCHQVYYWTDIVSPQGKSPEEIEATRRRMTRCKYCNSSNLHVEQDKETETGKVLAAADKEGSKLIDEILMALMREKGALIGVRMDSRKNSCQDRCPQCNAGPLDGTTGFEIDKATNVMGRQGKPIRPKPGDISICGYCTCVMVFTRSGARLGVRRATEEEVASFSENKEFLLALAAAKNVIAKQ